MKQTFRHLAAISGKLKGTEFVPMKVVHRTETFNCIIRIINLYFLDSFNKIKARTCSCARWLWRFSPLVSAAMMTMSSNKQLILRSCNQKVFYAISSTKCSIFLRGLFTSGVKVVAPYREPAFTSHANRISFPQQMSLYVYCRWLWRCVASTSF